MSKNNRKCRVCGREYYYCPTCGSPAPLWHKLYDTEACRDVYTLSAKYNYGTATVEEFNSAVDKMEVPIVDETILEIIAKKDKETKPLLKSKIDIVNESMK